MSPAKTMKAAVVVQPGRLEIRQIPVPQPSPFEALVRIEACGFCGSTDRHLIAGTQCHHPRDGYPAVLGHEAVGTVVAVGEKVVSFKVGDRVTRPVAIWPGERRDGLHSAWGGFAEFGIVRDRAALVAAGQEAYRDDYTAVRQHVAPAGMDAVDASLAISIAEVASWMWKLDGLGRRAVAVGGSGFVGCLIAFFAKLAGASAVIMLGRRDKPLERGKKCGADIVVNTTKQDARRAVREATGGVGVDVFAEATGADEIFNVGLGCLRSGGTLAIYGAPEGYRYTLAMKNAGGEFAVKLVHPEEHLAYEWVCSMIQRKLIDCKLFHSHVWDGLESLPQVLQAQQDGQALKSLVRIS